MWRPERGINPRSLLKLRLSRLRQHVFGQFGSPFEVTFQSLFTTQMHGSTARDRLAVVQASYHEKQ